MFGAPRATSVYDAVCALPAPLTSCSPISLPLLSPPYSVRHNSIEIMPVNNPTMASKCSSVRKSHTSLTSHQKLEVGFPGGAVVENLPANAGDTSSSPGLGRSHVPRSGWAHEPQLLSLRIWSLCPATGGAAIVRGPRTVMKSSPRTAMKSGPHLPQLEKALARTEDPTQPKINK